MSRLHFPVIL